MSKKSYWSKELFLDDLSRLIQMAYNAVWEDENLNLDQVGEMLLRLEVFTEVAADMAIGQVIKSNRYQQTITDRKGEYSNDTNAEFRIDVIH